VPRPLRILAVAALTLVLLAGCTDEGGPRADAPAATVNGAEITTDELDAAIDALIKPPATDTKVAMSDASGLLGALIELEVARTHLEAEDIEIDDETRSRAEAALIRNLGRDPNTGVLDLEAGQAALDEMEDVERDLNLDFFTLLLTLSGTLDEEELGITPVTDDVVRESYDASLDTVYTTRCVNGIAVDPTDPDPEATGEAIAQALRDGEDFDDVVAENSPDPANPAGGDFGCVDRQTLSSEPELAEAVFAAELEEVVGPIATTNGTLVLVVYDEQVTAFEDVEATIRADLEDANLNALLGAAQARIGELLVDADVVVDPRYGSWGYTDEAGLPVDDPAKAVSAGIVPPEGPADAPVDPDDTVVDPLTGLPPGATGDPTATVPAP
jgi:hypothetical protein